MQLVRESEFQRSAMALLKAAERFFECPTTARSEELRTATTAARRAAEERF